MKTSAHAGFKDRSAFDAALHASTAPEIVILDGVTVRGGVEPAVEFVTTQPGPIVPKDSLAK